MPDGYVPAARIFRQPDGSWASIDCLLYYSRPVPVRRALETASQGKTVFVQRADAPEVLAKLRDNGSANGSVNG